MRISAVASFTLACLALAACQSDSTGPSSPKAPSIDGRPSAFVGAPCPDCAFGPRTYTRGTGGPETITEPFTAVAGGRYTVDIDDLGSSGADGSVELNGVTLLAKRAPGEVGPRHVVVEVTLGASNSLLIRVTGKKGSQLQVSVWPLCPTTPLPAPVLELQQIRPVVINGVSRNVYELNVPNSASYPDPMFAKAPTLPACGQNTSASRTWVEIYVNGFRYYGYCALSSASLLNGISFSWNPVNPPPTSAYIVLNDRRCGITYESNHLSLPSPQ